MNKKRIYIPVLTVLGVLLVGTMSNALALYSKPAVNATVGISQKIDYYLRGTFNSWSVNNSYLFVDNTANMEEEVNKVKEYKLENVQLAKDAQLRVWANNNVWYTNANDNCVYDHSWSNAESFSEDEYHNYIVPMTSNTYTFLLKFYSDGSSKIDITANKDVLFFAPSNNWKQSEAVFFIKQYDGESVLQNTIEDSVENPAGTFRYELGTTYSKYQFSRVNPADHTDEWNYSNVLNLANFDTNNCFTLWDNYYSGGEVWNAWNAADGSEVGVSCGVWSAM